MVKMKKLDKMHPLYLEDLKNATAILEVEELYNKSFLITGSTGLIGSFLIDTLMYLNKRGGNISIFAVGRSKERAKERLGEYFNDSNFIFIEQDVRNPLPSNLDIDYIVPLASNTHPLAYSQYPVETVEINVKGASNALMLAKEKKSTVLYPSSVEIYGNARNNDVFDEGYTGLLNLSNARSCYPESKRLCEALCQSYYTEYGVKVKIVRLCRVFGPTMLDNDTKASSQFIMKALNYEDVVLKSLGNQYYSYLYIADAIAAMLTVLLHGEYGLAYNLANENCNVSLKEFASTCAKISNRKVVFDIPVEVERKGYSIATKAILDNARICDLGWRPYYDFNNSIERTLLLLR